MKDYLPLQNFWKRYNNAQMDKLSLDREKTVLKSENTKLRAILKQYLDGKLMFIGDGVACFTRIQLLFIYTGISVNSDVLDHPNPLVITTKKIPEAARYVCIGISMCRSRRYCLFFSWYGGVVVFS